MVVFVLSYMLYLKMHFRMPLSVRISMQNSVVTYHYDLLAKNQVSTMKV